MGNHKRRRNLKAQIHRRAAPGTRPGTMNVAPDALATTIDLIAYDKDHFAEKQRVTVAELDAFVDRWPIVWVHICGLGSEETLKAIAAKFHIHPLAMEDVVNVHQRAKADQYEQNVYCVVRMPDGTNDQLTTQLSIVFGKNYLVTFQEGPSDCFDQVRNRLRHEQSVVRQETQPDFLAYRLVDAVVDAYFPILERLGDKLDELDDRTTAGKGQSAFAELHLAKRELLLLRRAIWPLRDAIRELQIEDTPLVGNQTRLFLRDCHDHAIQLIDLVEAYRDIASDIRDFHLSSVSLRMNEIMKTLTIIATIFMPLSFIAGLYGMNFNPDVSPWNMPELNWRYGYPFALAIMAAVAMVMLSYFKRHGWIWRGAAKEPENGNSQPGPNGSSGK
ncbi:MAG: magnesium/cobalt transporter CorA [Pirellulales bacterium]